MKGLRSAVAFAAATLVLGFAAPIAAAPAPQPGESYRIMGTIAYGSWSSQEDAEVGMPRVVYVSGGDAIQVRQVKGSKPVSEVMLPVVAYGTTLVDEGTGEPYGAEVWAIPDEAEFVIDSALTEASLAFEAEGIVVTYDEETGEEAPNGVTIPLEVSAHWTGIGPLTTSKSHDKFTEPGLFTIDRGTSTYRAAAVTLTLTSPDRTIFDGVLDQGEMSVVKAATLIQYR